MLDRLEIKKILYQSVMCLLIGIAIVGPAILVHLRKSNHHHHDKSMLASSLSPSFTGFDLVPSSSEDLWRSEKEQ